MKHLLTTLLLTPALTFGQVTDKAMLLQQNEAKYEAALYELCLELNRDQITYQEFHRCYVATWKAYRQEKKNILYDRPGTIQSPDDLYIIARETEE